MTKRAMIAFIMEKFVKSVADSKQDRREFKVRLLRESLQHVRMMYEFTLAYNSKMGAFDDMIP